MRFIHRISLSWVKNLVVTIHIGVFRFKAIYQIKEIETVTLILKLLYGYFPQSYLDKHLADFQINHKYIVFLFYFSL